MRTIKNIWKGLLSLLFATAIFFVCLFPYRAILNYHEQMHLFRWNSYYFREQFTSLEGAVEYIVSFITQFFYIGWLGALVVALLAVLLQLLTWKLLKIVHYHKAILYPLTFLLPVLLFYFVFIPKEHKNDSAFRESIEYDYLVRDQAWYKIMVKSYNHPPETMNGIWCTNYALAKRGVLLDDMFYYKQDGPDGLLMDAQRMQPLALFSLSDIAFDLGLINTAERFAFDVKQRIPDNHKSGRIYKRLAETNLINQNYKVAQKYMQILQSTLFYRNWANHNIGLLWDENAIESDSTYSTKRRVRQKSNDQLAQVKDQMLEELVKECPDNKMASDYLLAYTMLRLDLERLTNLTLQLKDTNNERVPKSLQESIAGYWAMAHPNDSLPFPINKEIFETTMSYLTTIRQTGNMQHPSFDSPPFSQSYWHYHTKAMAKLKQMRQ